MLKPLLMSSAALAAAMMLVQSAAAFDCDRAASDVEKTICSDPAAKAADEEMSAAYEALLPVLQGEQAEMLKANQTAWLALREQNCGWQEQAAEKLTCLIEITGHRAAYLQAKPASGPGLGEGAGLVPYLFSRPESRTVCSADVAVFRFPDTAAGADVAGLNGWVSELTAGLESEFGAVEEGDLPEGMTCEYTASALLTYASPKLIAMHVSMYVFGGGAHGMSTAKSVTLDRSTGEVLAFGDIFPAEALEELTAVCAAGIRAEKTRRFAEAEVENAQALVDEEMGVHAFAITEGVSDLSSWLVYEDRAEVYFPPYAVGAYAEGDYQCVLPKAALQKAAGDKSWIVP